MVSSKRALFSERGSTTGTGGSASTATTTLPIAKASHLSRMLRTRKVTTLIGKKKLIKILDPPSSPRPNHLYRNVEAYRLFEKEHHLLKVNRRIYEMKWTNRNQWKQKRDDLQREMDKELAFLKTELILSESIGGLVKEHSVLYMRCEELKIKKLYEQKEVGIAAQRKRDLDEFIAKKWPGLGQKEFDQMWPRNTVQSVRIYEKAQPKPSPKTPPTITFFEDPDPDAADYDWVASVLDLPSPVPSPFPSSELCCLPEDQSPKC